MNQFNVNETLSTFSRFDLKGSKNDELNQQSTIFNMIYNNHVSYLENLVSNFFVLKNLPFYQIDNKRIGTISKRIRSTFVEFMLSFQGLICCSWQKDYGFVITPCTILGQLNLYGDPVKVVLTPPYSSSFDFPNLKRELDITKDKFVVIRNDNLCVGFAPLIFQTAYLLTSCMMSATVNVNQQKFPLLVYGSSDTKLSFEILKNKMDSYETIVFLKDNGNFDVDKMRTMNIDVPYVADKMLEHYQKIMDNFFMRVGINSIMSEKKERLVVDEVNANNQAIQTSGDVYLQNRLEGWEAVNLMFDMNVEVRRNVDFIQSLKKLDTEKMMNDIKGGAAIE